MTRIGAPSFAPDFDYASDIFSTLGDNKKEAGVRKSTMVRTLAGSIMA